MSTDTTGTEDTSSGGTGVAPVSVWPQVSAADIETFETRVTELLADWGVGFDAGTSWYSRDDRVRIWDGTAVPRPGFAAYGPLVAPYMEQVESLHNRATDVQVLRAPEGGLAVTVSFLHNTGQLKDGTTFEEHMRETLVWAEQDGHWRVVHEHTSHLPDSTPSS